MRKASWTLIFALVGGPVFAEDSAGKASLAAVEACKAINETFAGVSKCLPSMDVAMTTLDAFSEIYPESAAPLKQKCIELNDDEIAAEVCVSKAIESAVSLASALPAGASLDDPLFDALKTPEDLEKLNEARKEAQRKFPTARMVGGTIYHPYK